MDREAIMEMLREYGVNSESDLYKAIKHVKPIDIGVFVTPVEESREPLNMRDIIIRKENENERELECASV